MQKAPKLPNETLRLKSLQSLKVLDTEPEERFDRITRLARKIFNVPIALVSLVDHDRQWFKSHAGIEASETPRDISFCGHAIAGHDVFIVPNASRDERFCDNPLVVEEPSIRFYAGYPLRAPNGTRLGTLCLIDTTPRVFSTHEAETLKGLGEMVEAELSSVTMATTDELTGLPNRRGFKLLAEHALKGCAEASLPATVILIDLDGFKRINDDLGHEAGDAALVEFARCLIKSGDRADIVARLGGDEFCGFATGSTLARGNDLVGRLVARVAEVNANRDSDYPIQFSAGCASFDASNNAQLVELMQAADEAMYRQKSQSPRAAAR